MKANGNRVVTRDNSDATEQIRKTRMPPKYITPVCSNAGQKANTFHMYIMTVIARPAAQLLSLNSQNVCAKKINP